jgi:ketosteroid isomerase-like protein
MSRLSETLRHAYQAFAADPDSMWERFDDGVVFRISGEHPLSGEYVGHDEVRRYLAAVREATGGRGGFSVTSAFTDEQGSEVLVEGTAFHGDGPFVRTVVHRLRVAGGKLLEFRDHPFDQRSEDRFWRARVPQQRDGHEARTPAEEPAREPAQEPGAVIPAQPTTTHITKG